MSDRPCLGISACLIGQEVRYDGGHKHNEYITRTLGQFFEFVPFCPEVAIGMGVPRPPIRLVKNRSGVRARGVQDSKLDVTDRLTAYAEHVAPQLQKLSGYILKKNSPSCGMERVRLYNVKGQPAGTAAGLYGGRLQLLCPELPFEEEGRLMDPVLRENFIERVFVYHRWQQFVAKHPTVKALVDFHTRHKFVVLAHDETVYRALGRLVAGAGRERPADRCARYIRLLMPALRKPATRTRHSNVLQHLAGYFKKHLDAEDKRELLELITQYRRGQLPRVVPVTLLCHYLRRFPDPYLTAQYYLASSPDAWMLRDST